MVFHGCVSLQIGQTVSFVRAAFVGAYELFVVSAIRKDMLAKRHQLPVNPPTVYADII